MNGIGQKKLMIDELTTALENNELELKQALESNRLDAISRLNTQRAVLKDCLIEALTENLNLLKRAI